MHSHRHFVGSEEQNNRKEQGTEVNNMIHLLDFSATYHVNARWSLSASVPVMFNDRWNQRTPSQVTYANGIGDLTLVRGCGCSNRQQNPAKTWRLGLA